MLAGKEMNINETMRENVTIIVYQVASFKTPGRFNQKINARESLQLTYFSAQVAVLNAFFVNNIVSRVFWDMLLHKPTVYVS